LPQNEGSPGRVFVARPGALGDLILTIPALAHIRSLHRTARITIAGNSEFLPLVREYADDLISFDSPSLTRLFSDGIPDFPFDLAYAWLKDPDDPFVRNLKRAGLRVLAAPSIQTTTSIHQADFLCQMFGDCAPHAELNFDPEEIKNAWRNFPDSHPRVVLHHGAGSDRKRWPLASFRMISQELRSIGANVFWIVGPAERADVTPDGVSCVRFAGVRELGAFLSGVDLFVGNDSGVSHLAAMRGVRTLVLFGKTNPTIWAPRGAEIVSGSDEDGHPSASVSDVMDRIGGFRFHR